MIQKINLYQDRLKPNTEANLFKLYLCGFALVIALLIGYCGFIVWETNKLETQLENASKKNTDAQNHLQEIATRFPERHIDSLLLAEMTSLQNQVSSLSSIVNKLSDTQSDQYQGFSRYFLAFAKQANSEAWLNRIFLNTASNSITLQGSTFISASVPNLLHRLQQEPIFQGKKFAQLEMKESPVYDAQIDFIVASQAEDEIKKP